MSTSTPDAAPTSRERILDTAGRLFYRDGFVSVGVDTITRESGVAKMTLYRHFPSKDDLIVAYLERANERFRAWIDSTMDPAADARARIEQVFDVVGDTACASTCEGCTFQHAAADFAEADHPAHAVALANKRAMVDRLVELAREAGAPDPDALGRQLFLLMEGAWATARTFDADSPARACGAAARALLDAHLGVGEAYVQGSKSVRVATLEEALEMEGAGWDGDLDAMRSTRDPDRTDT